LGKVKDVQAHLSTNDKMKESASTVSFFQGPEILRRYIRGKEIHGKNQRSERVTESGLIKKKTNKMGKRIPRGRAREMGRQKS